MGRFCAYTLICAFIQIGVLHGQPSVLDSLRFEPVVTGLTKPVDADEFPPGSGRFLITQQEGLIRVFNGQELLEAPFLDLSNRVSCCGELGLLNVALHPRFDSNGLLYVHYTDSNRHTTVSRFGVGDNPDVAEPESELILLTLPQEKANHKGGRLLFGADDYLYIGLGDGGFTEEAQNLGSWYGSILRIDVDGGDPYSVPATNPFVARPGAKAEIWAFGLRNPWSFTFDRLTGDMFIGDVGQVTVEELDFLPAGSGGGQNYGWRVMEGSLCFPEDRPCDPRPFVAPIFDYRHVPDDCAAVIAGHRYRGPSIPALQGTLIFADHCMGQRGQMFAGIQDGEDWILAGRREVPFNISAFTEDSDGEIYLIDHNRGEIRRIEADPPVPELSRVSPREAVAGGQGFLLSILGSDFVPTSRVTWDGAELSTRFITNYHVQALISPELVAVRGSVQLNVANRLGGGPAGPGISFRILESPSQGPVINASGIVDAAGFIPGRPLAPGSIAAVFGADLALRTEFALASPLPGMLGGGSIIFGDLSAAPVYAASPAQANVLIPWELAGQSETTALARVGSAVSSPLSLELTEFSPGIFAINQTGAGQGAVLIAGSAGQLAAPTDLFSSARPARAGEWLVIFAAGLGPVSNQPATGDPSPASPLSRTRSTPAVLLGGVVAPVAFSGLAPGFVGLYQVNAQVPEDAVSGEAVSLSLTISGIESNVVTVAID